jgi:hypothetical protein
MTLTLDRPGILGWLRETDDLCSRCITGRIHKLGREIGRGAGASPNLRRRREGTGFERVTTRPRGLGRP